jgi:hypothetical protein
VSNPNEQAVIIRLKLSDDEFGERSEREAAYALEDQLIEVFSTTKIGEFDGHEFAGGFATLYMYGPSADGMAEAVLSTLLGKQFRDGSSITVRFGPPGSAERVIRLTGAA